MAYIPSFAPVSICQIFSKRSRANVLDTWIHYPQTMNMDEAQWCTENFEWSLLRVHFMFSVASAVLHD